MSEIENKTETTPIVEEPQTETKSVSEPEPIKEKIEVIPSDEPLNVSKNVQVTEHTDKKVDQTPTETVTEENKSKEQVAEMIVNDESLKVETTTSETVTEDKVKDDEGKETVVVKKATRGRVSRTAKSGQATSTEIVEVIEEKKPVEEETTPKRGRGRQAKQKSVETTPEPTPKKQKSRKTEKKPESDTEESVNEKKEEDVPLLEQSLTVEGKRQRKTTQRLELNVKESSSKHSYTPQGKGTPLGDIPRICYFIDKTTSDNLRHLYRVLIGIGQVKSKDIKKTIKSFNGFGFDKNSVEYEKRQDLLVKLTMYGLKFICEILDLEKSGTKDVVMERILEFLIEPKDSGRPIPTPKSKRKSKGKAKSTPRKKQKVDESVNSAQSESEQDEVEEEEKSVNGKSEPNVNGKKEDKKSGPSEQDLKKTIKEIVETANLDKVTMKKVIQDVYAKYPEHNLNDQKNFIKQTVKELLEA